MMRRKLSHLLPILDGIDRIAAQNGQRSTDEDATMAESIRKIGEFLPSVLERVRPGNEARRGISGVATGLRSLDELTGGWQNGDLIIIGGRPSMGKTALACQFALHAALSPQVPVIYFSLDITRENLLCV